MIINKNDFIELEFTGFSNGEMFDTTDKKEAKEMGLDADVKPIIISVGNGMLLKGFDDSLEGKELGKRYSIKLSPDKAFGPRNPKLIKTMPMGVFIEKKMNPYPGMTLQMDNYIAKVLSVSGGRVIVDFNNPLAGKEIEYSFMINKKIDDDKEKIDSLMDFFLKQRFDFEIMDKKVIFKDEKVKPFIEIFKQRFKDMTGIEFETIKQEKHEDERKNLT
ncbi:MAG: peptidylprolyl isomerase [Nanoarchaeota archaeon]|nr:peptidylprolyl isomerase [Nanoarchaeota archaeon]